jgi:hypothetical protein
MKPCALPRLAGALPLDHTAEGCQTDAEAQFWL